MILFGSSQYMLFGVQFFLLPFPFMMLFFSKVKEKRLSRGGLLGTTLIAVCSVLISTLLFSSALWYIYLGVQILGFGILYFRYSLQHLRNH